jgi:hypothetical protein
MSISRKLIEAAAGSSDDAVPFVEDVFSTYLYEGTTADQTIENGIDLDDEDGLVWMKNRDSHASGGHYLFDTVREADGPTGAGYLKTNTTDAAPSGIADFSFNTGGSTGFTVGATVAWNASAINYASWTFRKAKNFFDVVTYTGNSVKGREIPHNLGVEPGMIIIKSSVHPGGVGNTDWCVYHNALNGGVNPEEYGIFLNKTSAASERELWNNTAPTDTKFTVNESQDVNGSGGEYVAYLFAHDDSDESMIKCGSYTGSTTVDLGFEPQWVLVKSSTFGEPWALIDNMRGFSPDKNSTFLNANTANAEITQTNGNIGITSTGFESGGNFQFGKEGETYIYVAIRRPTKPAEEFEPEKLFAALPNTFADGDPGFKTGFPVDMAISDGVSMGYDKDIASRLTGTKRLETNTNNPEGNQPANKWDYMDGFLSGSNGADYGWLWRRAPGYFDVVPWSGDGTSGRAITHNLGVTPEMIWLKNRTSSGGGANWIAAFPSTAPKEGALNSDGGFAAYGNITAFSASTVTLLNGAEEINNASHDYIAYLFATVPGISKVGSYTGNGSEVEVDCGFTNGARWLLIKRTDSAGDWYFTSNPGAFTILSKLNTTDAPVNYQATYNDVPSGFRVTSTGGDLCVDGAEYIFYAIA